MTYIRRITLIESDDFDATDFANVHAQLIDIAPEGSQAYHIGSTSIPGIACKPLLDVMLCVRPPNGLAQLDAMNTRFEAIGYEVLGEFGILGRRYYRQLDARSEEHLVHVHAFLADDPHTTRHLAFRDFMRTHHARAKTYSDLKHQLVLAHDSEREAYMDGKHDFITHTDTLAAQWIARATFDHARLMSACHALAETLDEEVHLDEETIAAHIQTYNQGDLLYHELIETTLAHMCVHRGNAQSMPLDAIRHQVIEALFPALPEWVKAP